MKAYQSPYEPSLEILHGVSDTDLASLDLGKTPQHIAIIPDGNRRWAKIRNTASTEGHRQGADTLMDVVKAAKDWGIKALTFYLFSTENWRRPQAEIEALLWLLQEYLHEQTANMVENGIRLQTIGDLQKFPVEVLASIEKTKQATAHCQKIDLIFALNYGGRDEIRRTFLKLLDDVEAKVIAKESISEEIISLYLDTSRWQDPDLLIRTSGEMRLSNFLLWQISYTEVFVSQVFWPDFRPKHLLEALLSYQRRQRRVGE